MNQKNLILILMAIVAMMMLTWHQNEDEEVRENAKLLPALKENLNHLGKVEVRTATDFFTLVKQDQGWTVLEKDSYPADVTMLSNLLEGLSKARLIEKKTAKPENYSILEVRDVSKEDSRAKLVSGFGDDYSFSILIGKTADRREGQFVRKPDADQVWLADRSLEVNTSVVAWLEPEIVNIESEKVIKIEQFDLAGKLQFTLAPVEGAGELEGGAELVLQNLPANRVLRYPSVTSELARSLANVRLTDVRPHEMGLWPVSYRAIYSLVDGRKITIRAINVEDKKWLHLSASEPASSGAESGADSGESADDLQSLGQWDYQVAGYVFDDFVKTLDDLLAEEEAAAPE